MRLIKLTGINIENGKERVLLFKVKLQVSSRREYGPLECWLLSLKIS